MVGADGRGETEAIAGLVHAVMHVVVLCAAQALVILAHAVVDLAAVERVGQRIHIAVAAAVAEGRCAAAETGGVQRAHDALPRGFGFGAQYAAAHDVFAGFQRFDIALEEIGGDARVRVQADHRVAGGFAQGDVDAAGQPFFRVVQNLYVKRSGGGECAHDVKRIVLRGAVHQQELDLLRGQRLGEQVVKQEAEAAARVERHDDKTDFHLISPHFTVFPNMPCCAGDR